MTQNSPRLTVIVPTRERPDTLYHTLRTIVAQKNPDIEILVSDNCSSPETKEVFDRFDDKRMRYIRTPERIGMADNYEFAISNAKGDWVGIVGDDDGLVVGAIDKLFSIIDGNPGIKAVVSATCFYRWPSDEINTLGSKLVLATGNGYEVRDGKKCLKKLMEGEIINLPTIYTGGYIRRDLIEEIKKNSPENKFFQSIIPDVYSSIAVGSVIDKYIYSREPLGITGSSKHGTGIQHKDKSREEMKKLDFYHENRLQFHPSLGDGAVESMQILLYECFLRSEHLRKDNMGITMENQLQLSMLNASGRVLETVQQYCREVAELNGLDFNQILKSAKLKRPFFSLKRLIKRIIRHIPGMDKRNRKTYKNAGIENVYDASIRIEELLS